MNASHVILENENVSKSYPFYCIEETFEINVTKAVKAFLKGCENEAMEALIFTWLKRHLSENCGTNVDEITNISILINVGFKI